MPLSLKAELEIWAAALKAYDEQEFLKSIELFSGTSSAACRIFSSVATVLLTRTSRAHTSISAETNSIDYEQLGLKFKLFSAEVLFNRGLSQLCLGYTKGGMNDLEQARKEKADHRA
ncbi:NADPH oxidase regulator NoxR [Pisolithus marmoratus]|nr:NADPH oxidase regulator NoxR [Pisolithus marmoratus]